MNAIPTLFKGIWFRSRLEAKWAAMLDQLGWRYEYEPFDLDGYIPDFIITNAKEPFIIEVKGVVKLNDPKVYEAIKKIENSGWEGEALITGATLFDSPNFGDIGTCLGLLSQWCWVSDNPEVKDRSWDPGLAAASCAAGRMGLWHEVMSYHCYLCGKHDGGSGPHNTSADQVRVELSHYWNVAANLVQWVATTSAPESSALTVLRRSNVRR